jgi:hypothetical protein
MRASISRLCVCLVLFLVAGWSQESRGTIAGVVTDAQGAVVPGAKITVVQVGTGSTVNIVSGAAGDYLVPRLLPGEYFITVQTAGFRGYKREGLQLSANQVVRVDVALEIGEATESVTVTADASLLTTATASIGQPITQSQLQDLPLFGRAALAVATLSMGVVGGPPLWLSRPFDSGNSVTYSIGGGLMSQNEVLIDGGPNMSQNRRTGYKPPMDSVQEVKVEVFQADAAYGDTSGGTLNVLTKAGANQLHGSLSWYNQTSNLAANNFFTTGSSTTKAVTLWNQWGVYASGPLMVPKVFHHKDRVFWSFAYEGVKHTIPQPFTLTVPTTAMKGGDFSALLKLGTNYTVYDPATAVAQGTRRLRLPFPGNIIPTSRFNQVAQNYLQYYPAPDQPGLADGENNYLAGTRRHDDYFTVMPRFDFNISDKHKFFWRYYNAQRTEYIRKYFDNIATGEIRPRNTEGSTFDDVYTFNGTTVLNVRGNWNRFWDAEYRQSDGLKMTTLGFPASLQAAAQLVAMPPIQFGDTTVPIGATSASFTVSEPATGNPGSGFVVPFDTWQLFGTLTKVQGSHSLKYGAEARLARESSYNANLPFNGSSGYPAGNYVFGTGWTNGPLDNASAAPNGQDFASFLLGLPTSGEFDNYGGRRNQAYYIAGFVQDDWRVSRRLTLNLGLRYEKETPTTEQYNRTLVGFDQTTANAITVAAKAAYAANPTSLLPVSAFNPIGGPIYANGQNRDVYHTDGTGFSPRFGFAYTPAVTGDKTVIRGGFGIFYAPYNTTGVQQPGFTQVTPFVGTQDGYLTSYANLSNPFPAGLLAPVSGAAGLGINTFLGQSLSFTNPHLELPYNLRWTMTLQQQLQQDLMLEVGYIGSHSMHLPENLDANYIPDSVLSTSPVRDQTTINALTANVANPFQGLLPGTTLNGSTIAVQQLLKPFPQLTGLTENLINAGYSYFESLDVQLHKRASHGLDFLSSFSLSKNMEAVSKLNPGDTQLSKKIASADRPYRFVLSGSYTLPFGKGKAAASSSRLVNGLLGGWVVSSVFMWQGGAALSWGNVIYYGGALNYDAHAVNGAFDTTQFNRVSSQQLSSNLRTFPLAFSNLRADSIKNLDLSISKNIPLKERVRLEFTAQASNALNRPQFGGPSTSPTSASFGLMTSTSNAPRVIQTGLRLAW